MRVFISYRRGDSAGHAGRLRDALERSLGPDAVFQDVTSLAPGEHFADAIRGNIEAADAVFVVIGRRWADATDADGRHRLDDPADVVRLEVETALASARRTIPVLVDGAVLPDESDLPPSMAGLLEAHAAELRDGSWSADVQRLVDGLRPPAPARRGTRWALAGGLAAVLVAVGAAIVLWPQDPGDEDGGSTTSTPGSALADDGCAAEPTGDAQPDPPEPTGVGGIVDMTVDDWFRQSVDGGHQEINVGLTVTAHNPDGVTISPDDFNAKVDGIEQDDDLFCYVVLAGKETLGNGDRVRLLVTGTLDDGAPIQLIHGGWGDPVGHAALVVLNP